jgi:hypothetical protein
VTKAISDAEIRVNQLTDCQKRQLDKALEISPREMCLYQEVKGIAQAEGKIDLDTAMLIYRSLGNWAKTNLATKVTLTQLFYRFINPKPATNL